MRERGGSIVNISSLAALEAYPLLGYKTMKAALISLTMSLAAANARYGVRVNVILPGLMNTPLVMHRLARQIGQGDAEALIADRNRRRPAASGSAASRPHGCRAQLTVTW